MKKVILLSVQGNQECETREAPLEGGREKVDGFRSIP
jgi:hypothetical protein